jgi:hypothetical protein
MVHFNIGPSRWDPTGLGITCIPFLPVRTSTSKAERFFTAGNERTPFIYNPIGTNLTSGSGYHLEKEDKFAYLVELMNMNMQDQIVYITMVYDFIDGLLPSGWNTIKGIWLDVNQCGTSEVQPLSEHGAYNIESEPWQPNFEGKVISAMGHLHDGGIKIDILANRNSLLCTAKTKYSETLEYVYRGKSMGGDKVAKDHISSMPGCQHQDIKELELKRDQSWLVHGAYDYSRYEGNLEKGRQSEVSLSFYPFTPLILSNWMSFRSWP